MKIVRPFTINDAALLSSNVPETDYAAYSGATTYALGDRAIYIATNTHWIVESLQNSNTGHTPTGLSSDTYWLKIGETNKWAMFNQSIQSQTSQADSVDVTFENLVDRINTVALYNINASTARVTVTDATDGVVFDQTVSLVSPSGINDWYAYFFEPIARLKDYTFTDLPPYLGADIRVILSDPGGTVLCGACVPGLSREIGGTQYGASVGIQDYSIKQADQFGNYSILERAYNKRAVFTIMIDNQLVDEVQNILSEYRATPAIYIGSDDFASLSIYGFFKDFSTVIAYPSHSLTSIELEGLT